MMKKSISNAVTLFICLRNLIHVDCFVSSSKSGHVRSILQQSTTTIYSKSKNNEEAANESLFGVNISSPSKLASRKDFIVSSGVLASILSNKPAFADDTTPDEKPAGPLGPITIIGSNGKTGSECVGACLSRSIPVRATSRGGIYSGIYADDSSKLLSMMSCDVTNLSTIESAVEGSRAVIFAASASKQGGTAAAVDNEGLANVAKACIAAKVPSLVIVSSGAVTKPDSPVYKFLNIFGKIMEEKIKGEDTVRVLYKETGGNDCTYTIIRPGGLTEEEGKGVANLELNQGDTKSGRIARADVASLCIESTLYPKLAGGTTFECYDADTAKPLATVGISNIMKAKNKSESEVYTSGKERRGSAWEMIFTGLEKD